MSDPGWSRTCCCSGPQGFSILLLGSHHNGEENLSPPSQLTSWVFWRSIWEHRRLHLTFTSFAYMHRTERPPQSPALLQGEPLSWLPSQDEDGSLSSLTAKEQHYVPEKKEGLRFALIYRFIYLEKSIQHKVSLLCDHTRCYATKPALSWNPPQLQSKYKWQKTHHLSIFLVSEKVRCFQLPHLGRGKGGWEGTASSFKKPVLV